MVAWRVYNALDTVQTAVNNVTVLASATATTGEKIAAGVELAGSLVGGSSGRQAAGSAVRAVEGGAAKESARITKEVLGRKALGADGAKSTQIIERENGKMISRTHEVTKDGKVIHQHQNHTGKHGGERQFPDEWTGTKTIKAPYENIPPSFPADRVPGGRTF